MNKRLQIKVGRNVARQDALRKERDAARTEVIRYKRELFGADALIREVRAQGSVADRNATQRLATLGKDAKRILVKMQAHSRRKLTRTEDHCQREIAGLKGKCAEKIKGAKEEFARDISQAKAEYERLISLLPVGDKQDLAKMQEQITGLSGQITILTKTAQIRVQAMNQLELDKNQLIAENDRLRNNVEKSRDLLDKLRTARRSADMSLMQARPLVNYNDHDSSTSTLAGISATVYDRFGSSFIRSAVHFRAFNSTSNGANRGHQFHEPPNWSVRYIYMHRSL